MGSPGSAATGSTSAKATTTRKAPATKAKTTRKAPAKAKPAAKAKAPAKAKPAAKAKTPRKAPAKAPAKAKSTSRAKDTAKVLSAAELMQQQLEQAQALMASGKSVPNHLGRAIRDAWLLDISDHTWASSAEVAGDMGVSQTTVDNWRGDGAPIEKASPVPKAPLLRWLYEREKTKAEAAKADRDEAAANVDLRIKLARATKEENKLREEAADFAQEILREECRAIFDALFARGPGEIVSAIINDQQQGTDHQGLQATVSATLTEILQSVRCLRLNDDHNDHNESEKP